MASSSRKFLIFSVHDSRYAIDLAQVAEVCDPPQIWPIPLAPVCFSGVLDFHGDIVSVMDLAFFLGLSGGTQQNKLIVLNKELASLAFFVDSVVKIVSEKEVSLLHATNSRFVVASFEMSEGIVNHLDLEELVRAAEDVMQKKQ